MTVPPRGAEHRRGLGEAAAAAGVEGRVFGGVGRGSGQWPAGRRHRQRPPRAGRHLSTPLGTGIASSSQRRRSRAPHPRSTRRRRRLRQAAAVADVGRGTGWWRRVLAGTRGIPGEPALSREGGGGRRMACGGGGRQRPRRGQGGDGRACATDGVVGKRPPPHVSERNRRDGVNVWF